MYRVSLESYLTVPVAEDAILAGRLSPESAPYETFTPSRVNPSNCFAITLPFASSPVRSASIVSPFFALRISV